MTASADAPEFDIFLAAPPGLEPALAAEAAALGFATPVAVPGGVEFRGGWAEVWRANLQLRGASRVLARVGGFRVMHLAQLDKRAHKFPWADLLRPDIPVRVEATSRKSRIYHAGAAAERIATAIADTLGAPLIPPGTPAAEIPPETIRLMARIDDDFCTFSVDASGEPLHKRGFKEAVGKAPMRETMAALFLSLAGWRPGEPLVDPMCGSGTFVIEAAEIAAGLAPGRARAFAFERLASFDAPAWAAMRAAAVPAPVPAAAPAPETPILLGSDRDDGAIRMSLANAARAGVTPLTGFERRAISDLPRPDGPPGLVIINPPYGDRIGAKGPLHGLYGAMGAVLKQRFSGWRVAMVTNEAGLARTTGLPFAPAVGPILHGGLKVHFHLTGRLP